MRKIALSVSTALVLVASGTTALAQPTPPPPQHKVQSQSNEPHQPTPEEEEELHNAYQRASEPEIAPPSDPLAMDPEQRAQIGSSYAEGPASPEGTVHSGFRFPYWEERRGDYRLRLGPLMLEHTRGLTDPSQQLYGIPKHEDTEGLYGLLYYRRRSLQLDMDVLFPAFWHVRDRENQVYVFGPLVHREAPQENDNWLAPIFFAGKRKEGGGYFHSLPLLTTSHWSQEGAFTLVGPFFYDRTQRDVDYGLAPLFFHGDNGSVDGNRRTYTLIPELLFYHSWHEVTSADTTIVGPVITQSDEKRSVFDIAPLFFHISGKPETGGVAESHTTLFPLFHWGDSPDEHLRIFPGFLYRRTPDAYTLLTPFFSNAQTRNGATSLTAVGPILPLYWNYRDNDLGVRAQAFAPFYYYSDSPAGHDWLTPLVGHFDSYGLSSTWWVAPTFTFNTNTHGWEDDLHPLIYIGRSDEASHTVVAPVFWDFANPKGRTTIGFPIYWRFAEGQNESVVQVAANTLYLQKHVAGGNDWSFHLLPVFSYGEDPTGYFWNFLFGLAGYSRHGASNQTRVFWIPFNGGTQQQTATAR
ncbi:MAG TPA: hypothetical protein VF765_33965 [Polyangiaceae bacterium]